MNSSTSPVDIRPDHLEIVRGILRAHLPAGFRAWAFGSRANWTATDASDLDLAVAGPTRLDYRAVTDLEIAFEESELPYTVDVVDLNAVSQGFRQIVEAQRVPLAMAGDKANEGSKWREVTLGDVADIVMGQSPSGNTVSGDRGLALLNGPTEFGPHHPTPVQFTTDARKRALPGDILFCVRGSTGRMNWADQEYAIGRGIAAIRHREEPALQPFVRGVIELELSDLLAQATGSVFTNVSASQIAGIPYPSLGEDAQRAIAHVLGALDDKIELNRRMNRTLEQMARAVFQDWFVDFGPVRAKLAGREPHLPPELWALFPDRLADSAPEGWGVKNFGDFADIVGGSTPSTKEAAYWEDGIYPFATPKDLSALSAPVLLDTERRITDAGLSKISSGLLPIGTVLLSSRAPIGYLAVAEVPVAVNQGFIAIKSKPGISNLFLLHSADILQDEIINRANGTTFLEISKRNFRSIPVVAPQLDIIAAFDNFARPLYAKIVVNEREVRTLAALRDALLPRLVSGEIRVTGTEKHVEGLI